MTRFIFTANGTLGFLKYLFWFNELPKQTNFILLFLFLFCFVLLSILGEHSRAIPPVSRSIR